MDTISEISRIDKLINDSISTSIPIDKINYIIGMYDYPLEVLKDVSNRINSNRMSEYVEQNYRYLLNLAGSGLVNLK